MTVSWSVSCNSQRQILQIFYKSITFICYTYNRIKINGRKKEFCTTANVQAALTVIRKERKPENDNHKYHQLQ